MVGAAGSAEEALDAGRGALAARGRSCSTWSCRAWAASRRSRVCSQASPGAGVLVFTAYDTDERVLGAVRAGARGYLLKGAAVAEIAARRSAPSRGRLGPGAAGRGQAAGRPCARRAERPR